MAKLGFRPRVWRFGFPITALRSRCGFSFLSFCACVLFLDYGETAGVCMWSLILRMIGFAESVDGGMEFIFLGIGGFWGFGCVWQLNGLLICGCWSWQRCWEISWLMDGDSFEFNESCKTIAVWSWSAKVDDHDGHRGACCDWSHSFLTHSCCPLPLGWRIAGEVWEYACFSAAQFCLLP